MTRDEAEAWHESRRAAIADEIDALPPCLADLVRRWRRPVELCGRAGQGAETIVEAFVRDVQETFAGLWTHWNEQGVKQADNRHRGSGA